MCLKLRTMLRSNLIMNQIRKLLFLFLQPRNSCQKMGKYNGPQPPNAHQAKLPAKNIIKTVPVPTRMAGTHITDIKSAFEMLIPSSIQKMILEMTNLEERHVFREKLKELDKTHLHAYLEIFILAWVYRSKDESEASLWDAETDKDIFQATMSVETFHIFSRVIRFDNQETRASRWEQDKTVGY